ncbi:hypothetical protein N7E70_007200 [Aminobacter sp. NyZ550]|uniref:hypothetical protein n=1 Tax=Aminobacter sp. NyZ550 TaxID=2979870 RepID=UPI0021D5754A|nr:hypothetical protein [Aminobacter sp. NyZ550]WAX96640.1 hypothetical protein N7E70_007200 [Aminobacter sp. NyZ550]
MWITDLAFDVLIRKFKGPLGGGLAAGAAITGILSRPASALQAAAVSRGLAQLVTSPSFRKWVTNTRQNMPTAGKMAYRTAAAPALVDVVTGALAENKDVQTAMEWLNEGASQIDQTGQRIVRPPQDAGSWERFFRSN